MRGRYQKAKKDGIYRASLRYESVYIRDQEKAVAAELRDGNFRDGPADMLEISIAGLDRMTLNLSEWCPRG